jgi:uncharacterized protein YicC (UPF0701 family)
LTKDFLVFQLGTDEDDGVDQDPQEASAPQENHDIQMNDPTQSTGLEENRAADLGMMQIGKPVRARGVAEIDGENRDQSAAWEDRVCQSLHGALLELRQSRERNITRYKASVEQHLCLKQLVASIEELISIRHHAHMSGK